MKISFKGISQALKKKKAQKAMMPRIKILQDRYLKNQGILKNNPRSVDTGKIINSMKKDQAELKFWMKDFADKKKMAL